MKLEPERDEYGEIARIEFPKRVWDWCYSLENNTFHSKKFSDLYIDCNGGYSHNEFKESGLLVLKDSSINFTGGFFGKYISKAQVLELIQELCDAYDEEHREQIFWINVTLNINTQSTHVELSPELYQVLQEMDPKIVLNCISGLIGLSHLNREFDIKWDINAPGNVCMHMTALKNAVIGKTFKL